MKLVLMGKISTIGLQVRIQECFCTNFMFLVDVLEDTAKGQCAILVIHVHAYLCLCLRDTVSLFSRVK
jgi:hypothetical protein